MRIHWGRILWTVLGVSFLGCVGLLIWYWTIAWLPQKESREAYLRLDQMAAQYFAEVEARKSAE